MATGWVFRSSRAPWMLRAPQNLIFFWQVGLSDFLDISEFESPCFIGMVPIVAYYVSNATPTFSSSLITNHFVRHCQLPPRCCSQCFPRTGDQPSGGRRVAAIQNLGTCGFQTSVNRPFSNRQSTWSTGRPHLVGGLEHFLSSIIYGILWDTPSHWLIFFKMVKTTNQTY